MGCYADPGDLLYVIAGVTFTVIVSVLGAFKIMYAVRTFLLCRIFPPILKKEGRWAVVTGSTDGIGKEYARELSARGFNLFLISRTQKRLNDTAAEFEDTYGIKTVTVQTDFSFGEEIYPPIREKIGGLNIDVLVNNVGALGKHPCKFLELSANDCVQYLNMNILSTVMMCQIILPEMVKKKHGYIVNVSSISSVIPLPLKSLYSASKAFVTSLSQSLSYEYADNGITIQSVVPSYVSTKLVKFSDLLQKPNFFVPDATAYVRSAISTLTISTVTTGYWTHGLQYVVSRAIPRHLYFFLCYLVQRSLDSRKKQRSE